MAKRPAPPSATEEEVRALLERYRCPVPFHERYQLLLAYDRKPHDLYIRRHQPHAAELRSFVALDPGKELRHGPIIGHACSCCLPQLDKEEAEGLVAQSYLADGPPPCRRLQGEAVVGAHQCLRRASFGCSFLPSVAS
jgi:hypothetical protein